MHLCSEPKKSQREEVKTPLENAIKMVAWLCILHACHLVYPLLYPVAYGHGTDFRGGFDTNKIGELSLISNALIYFKSLD